MKYVLSPRVVHGDAMRGAARSRTYRIWQAMLNRCRNQNVTNYKDYGGRGITVCARWHVYTDFLSDMGECPLGHSIDRKDNDGNYEPGNCIWSTRHTQTRNKRTNRMLTFNGVTKCLKDWAISLGIDQASMAERLRKWPRDRAFTEPKLAARYS